MRIIIPDGGSGGGGQHGSGGGGGGNLGTGTGSTITGIPANENGGLVPNTYYLFLPVQDTSSGTCYIGIYDVDNLNDTVDGSTYSYRQEDIAPMRVPTVNRIGIVYRDLGPAALTVTVTATNDLMQIVQQSTTVQIGNNVPTNQLMRIFAYLSVTGFGPQLSLSVAPGGGPVSIAAVTMFGEVEETQLG